MKLEQSFDVDAPLEQVWDLLIDVQRVAPCLPGAQLTEVGDDGTYNGTFSVKIGPATAAYRGTLKMEEVDDAAHRVTMRATGTDKRGQGGAKALMVSVLSEREGGGTHVEVETDMSITGRLASFSRGGMIQDVSNRLLADFAACLQSQLATQEQVPAGNGDETAAMQPGQAEAAAASAAAASGDPASASAAAAAAGAASAPRPAAAHSAPPPAQAKPISGLRLLIGVLRDRLRRLFGRASS
jgi:carbon monoxide dehydrogenase subunit G